MHHAAAALVPGISAPTNPTTTAGSQRWLSRGASQPTIHLSAAAAALCRMEGSGQGACAGYAGRPAGLFPPWRRRRDGCLARQRRDGRKCVCAALMRQRAAVVVGVACACSPFSHSNQRVDDGRVPLRLAWTQTRAFGAALRSEWMGMDQGLGACVGGDPSPGFPRQRCHRW